MTQDWVWVDSPESLQCARDAITGAPKIGVDTEYDSFRYFREKLCLLQVRAGETTYLFDPLGKADFSFLGDVFASIAPLKVLHAGDNDIRILRRDYGFAFRNVFDTSRAAALLGCSYLSLATLIGQYLGVEFEKRKKLQRSQWENRPLSDEQVAYAVRDTSFLVPLQEKLLQELQDKGLVADAERTFDEIAQVVWQEKTFDARGYSRIPGYTELTADQQRILKRLHKWRFCKATEINRAVFMVLSDNELLNLAKAAVTSPSGLITTGGLSPDKASRYGKELIAIMEP